MKALTALSDNDLLKLGKDLTNFISVCLGNIKDESDLIALLKRVGRLDNDLVLLCLQNKHLLMLEPKLLEQVVVDLVKYYMAQQQAAIEPILRDVLLCAVSSKKVNAVQAVSKAIHSLVSDKQIDQPVLMKFRGIMTSLKLNERVESSSVDDRLLRLELLFE